MGLDIYGFIEYKRPEADEWISFADRIRLERDTNLFRKLGGLRSEPDITVIAPRGLPDDISVSVRHYLNEYGGGERDHSWLTFDEVEAVATNLYVTYRVLCAAMQAFEDCGFTTRFVFMFEG